MQIIIRIIRVIRVQQNLVFKPPVSAPPRTKIREIRAIRVQKNIRDIRFITSLRSVGLRRISCSKHLVRASKFIIGQFHIAASRNNSTFNIQNSTLRSVPPREKIFVLSALLPPFGQWAYGESRVQKTVSAPPRTSIRESAIRVLKIYSCYPRYSCSKKFMVRSVFKNLVFPM